MHIVPPYLTTTSTKKRSSKKPTKAMLAQWTADWTATNRDRRRTGEPKISFEDWLNERRGIVTSVKTTAKTYINRPMLVIPEGRSTRHIPSLMTHVAAPCVKKESLQYTGVNMLGVSQMHKSNAVPVFRQEDAVNISKMRR